MIASLAVLAESAGDKVIAEVCLGVLELVLEADIVWTAVVHVQPLLEVIELLRGCGEDRGIFGWSSEQEMMPTVRSSPMSP